MKVNLSDISKLYQGYLNDRRSLDKSLCPEPERLVKSVMTGVPAKEKAEITRHVADCAACAEALKGLLGLSAEIDRLAERVAEQTAILSRSARERGSFDTRTFGLWILKKPLGAILTGLAAVAVVALFVFQLRDRSGTRGGQAEGIQAISPIKVSVPKDSIRFRWESLTNASYYKIDLFDKSFALIWQSGPVHGSNLQVSFADNKTIIPGERYFWMVAAVLNDYKEVKSKLAEFSIKR